MHSPRDVHAPHSRSHPAQLRRGLRARAPSTSRATSSRPCSVANAIEEIRLSLGERLRILARPLAALSVDRARRHRGRRRARRAAPRPGGWRRAGLRPAAPRRRRVPAPESVRGLGDARGARRRRGRSREVPAHHPGLLGLPVRVRRAPPRDALAAAGQLRHRPPRVRSLPARARARRRRRRARGRPRDGGRPTDAGGCAWSDRSTARVRGAASSSAPAATAVPWRRPSARSPSAKRSWSRRRARRGCRPSAWRRSAPRGTRPSSTSSRDLTRLRLVLPQGRRPQHRRRLRRGPGDGPAASARRARRRRCAPPGRLPADLSRSSRSAATRTSCGAGRRGGWRASGFCLVGDAAGLARDLSGEGIGPAIRSGLLAADGGRGAPPRGRAADGVRDARSSARYGSGETGWLGRQLARLPEPVARAAVRAILGIRRVTRRHVVFGAHLRHAGGAVREATTARAARTRRPIAHHYDVSNEFYALFLDPLMVYTCAYYRDPDGKLEQAQQDKLDHVCRKLELQRGETHARHRLRLGQPRHLGRPALRRAGARRDAVAAQADYADRAHPARGARRTAAASSTCDYRDLPAGRSLRQDRRRRRDRARRASPTIPAFFGGVRARLKDGGLYLNHGIVARVPLEAHQPDRVPLPPRVPERRSGRPQPDADGDGARALGDPRRRGAAAALRAHVPAMGRAPERAGRRSARAGRRAHLPHLAPLPDLLGRRAATTSPTSCSAPSSARRTGTRASRSGTSSASACSTVMTPRSGGFSAARR